LILGLQNKHLDKEGKPIPARKKADFRGTVSFASLNAHYCIVSHLFIFFRIYQEEMTCGAGILYFLISTVSHFNGGSIKVLQW